MERVRFNKGANVDIKANPKYRGGLGAALMHEYQCHAYQMIKYRSGQTMDILEFFKNTGHIAGQRNKVYGPTNAVGKAIQNAKSGFKKYWDKEMPSNHRLKRDARTGKPAYAPMTDADKIMEWVRHYSNP